MLLKRHSLYLWEFALCINNFVSFVISEESFIGHVIKVMCMTIIVGLVAELGNKFGFGVGGGRGKGGGGVAKFKNIFQREHKLMNLPCGVIVMNEFFFFSFGKGFKSSNVNFYFYFLILGGAFAPLGNYVAPFLSGTHLVTKIMKITNSYLICYDEGDSNSSDMTSRCFELLHHFLLCLEDTTCHQINSSLNLSINYHIRTHRPLNLFCVNYQFMKTCYKKKSIL